jgi:hypothetical protein
MPKLALAAKEGGGTVRRPSNGGVGDALRAAACART